MLQDAHRYANSPRGVSRALSGLLICSSLAAATAPAAIAQQQNSASPAQRSIFVLRISPPQSGVRLLEELFNRVRSAPQVAMAKNLKQQMEAQALPKDGGPTDYSLAIRPKQQGKIALAPSPTVPLTRTETKPTLIASGPSTVGGIAGGGGGAQYTDMIAQAPAAEPTGNTAPVIQSWLGNRQLPASPSDSGAMVRKPGLWENSVTPPTISSRAMDSARFYNAPREIQTLDDRPVVRDFRELPEVASQNAPAQAQKSASMGQYGQHAAGGYGEYRARANSLAAAPASTSVRGALLKNINGADASRAPQVPTSRSAQAVPDLATAAGRMYNLGKQMESLQNGEINNEALRAQAEEKLAKAEKTAYKAKESLRSDANLIAGKKSRLKSADAKDLDQAKGDALADEELEGAEYDKRPARRFSNKVAWGQGGIAALPPNVVTGIPLVRLGISESQASNALNTAGSTKHDKVEKWTVLSWQRSANKAQTALQLYVRNGQLDAMRIFDPSLIAPSFGVSMGDDLSRVKEKFGEPAFILPEPGPGAGQNYIYPISQVGFQLSRSAPDQQPRVLSVLIFNVK